MRGKIKTVSWLSLILVIMIAMMANLGTSTPATNTKVYVDPIEVSGILPDDPDPYFEVNIMISDVVDLWTVGFTVDYTPFVKTIVAIEVSQGDFLEDGFQTWFIKNIDTFRGEVKVGYSRLPKSNQFPFPSLDPVGQDGSGLLATIKFKVVSAGESPINLVDVGLHDRNGDEIGCQTRDGYFYGPTANLIRGHVTARDMEVGETQGFYHKIKNTATVPLEVKASWDMYRVEDGQRLQIYSGQSYTGFGPVDYEYLYVDAFDEMYYEWDNPPENLFGEPDGNYIEASGDALWATEYSFEDITLGDRLIGNLILEGYCQYPNGATGDVDIDMYAIQPVAFSWFGSLWGTEDWDWHGVRWTTDTMLDVIPALGTEEGLNGLTILVYSYLANPDNPIRVDSLRIRVEFSKFTPVSPETYVLQPGEVLELPASEWTLKPDDVGKWITTLTCDYKYGETAWIPSEKVKTLTWWVTES